MSMHLWQPVLLDLVRHAAWFLLVFVLAGFLLCVQIAATAMVRGLKAPAFPKPKVILISAGLLPLVGLLAEGIFQALRYPLLHSLSSAPLAMAAPWVSLGLAGAAVGAIIGRLAPPYLNPMRAAAFGVVGGLFAAWIRMTLPMDLLPVGEAGGETWARLATATIFTAAIFLSERWPALQLQRKPAKKAIDMIHSVVADTETTTVAAVQENDIDTSAVLQLESTPLPVEETSLDGEEITEETPFFEYPESEHDPIYVSLPSRRGKLPTRRR